MNRNDTGRKAGPLSNELRAAVLLVSPLLALIGLFILVPVIGTVVGSLFQDVAFMPRRFVGFGNYGRLFADARGAAGFTMLFIAVSVPLELLLGLVLALLMDARTPVRGLLRACVLIPWAIPAAISGRTWELIYNYSYGLANAVARWLGISSEPVNWLGTSFGAFWAVIIADVWKTTPFVAIILLAGLQAIPRELYHQARVDRAGLAATFLNVTLPLLRPVLVVAMLFRTIDGIRIFDLLYVLTGGGPGGSTTSVSLYAYEYFLSSDFGYGSAISFVLFAIAMGLSLVYVKAGRFGTQVQ